jgi:hypothetical protein
MSSTLVKNKQCRKSSRELHSVKYIANAFAPKNEHDNFKARLILLCQTVDTRATLTAPKLQPHDMLATHLDFGFERHR